ncbi:MAG: DnaJ C-terminal domain-containing protein [Candidatus Paceibacterota bacterium]
MRFEKDYYKVLGLSKDADSESIKKRYRELAREYHPDKNKGDRASEEMFKEVSEAYSVLGDTVKRSEYDRGREYEASSEKFSGVKSGLFDDIISDMFGRGSKGMGEYSFEVRVPLKTAIRGGEVNLNLSEYGYGMVNVKIPAGCYNGSVLKLSGKGLSKVKKLRDISLVIEIEEHPVFSVKGRDIYVVVPISVVESVLGGEIEVPSVYGERITLVIKPGVKSGKRYRVAGKGINSSAGVGDMFIMLDVEPYLDVSKKGKSLLLEFEKEAGKDVRKRLFKESKL